MRGVGVRLLAADAAEAEPYSKRYETANMKLEQQVAKATVADKSNLHTVSHLNMEIMVGLAELSSTLINSSNNATTQQVINKKTISSFNTGTS
jgi:hypothetical protein